MRGLPLLTSLCVLAGLVSAPAATAQSTGGAGYREPAAKKTSTSRVQTAPGQVATIGPDGKAIAPAGAPPQVQTAIAAANRIVGKPYRYGGGHAKVEDTGYDCSGTISYALLGGGLMKGTPLDSGSFMRWGEAGKGEWVTVYTNPGHAYVVIAGLRLDTSAAGDPGGAKGPRWRPALRSSRGFVARHPAGF
jgi:hypothetical protein